MRDILMETSSLHAVALRQDNGCNLKINIIRFILHFFCLILFNWLLQMTFSPLFVLKDEIAASKAAID